jgi:putative membrane protein
MGEMLGFLLTVLVTAVSLLILARISIGLDVDDTWSALLAALVLGLLNATLRPILGFLAFPITLLTFGLFAIVLNAIVLYITAALVKGFHVRGFVNAIIASILLGILNAIIFWVLGLLGW